VSEENMTGSVTSPRFWILLVLASLAILAYLPTLTLPFISDDYLQINLGRLYGPVSGWGALAADALYRCRATSLVLTYWTERVAGLHPLPFYASSLLLHILNVWLLFALGAWKTIGWRNSAVAAGFFAVYEGHQEAVVWYAAVHELLLFCFALLCFHCWIRWLGSNGGKYYWASISGFLLALGSKEAAVAIVPMLVVIALVDGAKWRTVLVRVLPFVVLAFVYCLLIYAARSTHYHFRDAGTFSLRAPFWITLPWSVWRLFWVWGLLSVIACAAWRAPGQTKLLVTASAWIVVSFLPYSFLTYMPYVPSRHTYLASAGLALLVASGFWRFRERCKARPWVGWALLAVLITSQYAFLWFKKRAQYIERAAPTEELVAWAAKVDGPVYVKCFPYSFEIAEAAIRLRLHKTVYPLTPSRTPAGREDQSNIFCWAAR